jgi:hypothetical protein
MELPLDRGAVGLIESSAKATAMNTTGNPYLPPQTDPVAPAGRNHFKDIATADLKKLRNDSHSIRTFSVLLILGAALMIVGVVVSLLRNEGGATMGMAELVIVGAAGGLNLLTAIGLMKRRIWARYLAMIMAVLALLGFPIGTLIGILLLVALGRSARLFGSDRLDHKMIDTEWRYRKANKIP